MDFFKTVFSTDLEPKSGESATSTAAGSASSSANTDANTGSGWNIGGLIKNVASKSESVIETYRRDLEEFGSGLKKETVAIREAATKSIDEIIIHGKEILAVDPGNDGSNNHSGKRYTRLEAQIMAIQSDEKTFLSNPDDLKDFESWKAGFDLEEKKEEIEMLLYDSDVLETMAEKFVPDIVDYWTFWYRYFYRVYKAKQTEEARAELVKRVISRDGEEEEDLSWEVDDDEELENIEGTNVEKSQKDGEKKREIDGIAKIEGTQVEKVQKDGDKQEVGEIEKIEGTQVENVQKEGEIKRELNQTEEIGGTNLEKVEKNSEIQDVKASKGEKLVVEKDKTEEAQDMEVVKEIENKQEEKIKNKLEEKECELVPEQAVGTKNFEASKSEKSTSTNDEKVELKNETEEDLDWDEIEDLGEKDETKSSANPNPNLKDDLHKRLSVAEDDEDLSWDIEEEDDDEPKKP